jgi:hypothetical protein
MPLIPLFFAILVLMVLQFAILHVTTNMPVVYTAVDIVIILFAVAVLKGVIGMVRELNYVAEGLFVIVVGQILMGWPGYWGMPSAAIWSDIIDNLTLFIGIVAVLYGLIKFQEKYKFD